MTLLAPNAVAPNELDVVQDTSLPPFAASTVGRWLNAERLHPWRYHAWRRIHDAMAYIPKDIG